MAIGGGTGLPAVLSGLRTALSLDAMSANEARDCLTAIVTVTDDGGSSGRLRRQLGILPPGDIRNCLVALAPDGSPFTTLLQHRFAGENDLAGHPVGNLLLAALTQMTGGFQAAVEQLSEMMSLRGSVLPSTVENVMLRAEFQSGEVLRGETAIAARGARIKRLSLDHAVRPVPETMRALINADVVVVGPGSLYTSIIPNLLVDGIASTLAGVRAVKIYVANLMTEPGETDGYTLEDHLAAIRRHVGFDLFDYVLVNSRPMESSVVARYARQGATPIARCRQAVPGGGTEVVEHDLLWQAADGKVRHAPRALADAILEMAQAPELSAAVKFA